MKRTMAPLSQKVFASVGSIVTKEGIAEIAPRNDEEWEKVRSAAMGVADAANLLMMESRARGKESDWIGMSQRLLNHAIEAADAAKAKDAGRLLVAGGDVFQACELCHYSYMRFSTWQRWVRSFESPCFAPDAGAWKYSCGY